MFARRKADTFFLLQTKPILQIYVEQRLLIDMGFTKHPTAVHRKRGEQECRLFHIRLE